MLETSDNLTQWFPNFGMHQNHLERGLIKLQADGLYTGFLIHLLWLFSCWVLSDSCDPMDCRPRGSFVHGISQARGLEWVAISSSKGSARPRNWTRISCIGSGILYHWTIREALWFSRFGVSKVCGFAFLVKFPGDADTAVLRNHSVWTLGLTQPEVQRSWDLWLFNSAVTLY